MTVLLAHRSLNFSQLFYSPDDWWTKVMMFYSLKRAGRCNMTLEVCCIDFDMFVFTPSHDFFRFRRRLFWGTHHKIRYPIVLACCCESFSRISLAGKGVPFRFETLVIQSMRYGKKLSF